MYDPIDRYQRMSTLFYANPSHQNEMNLLNAAFKIFGANNVAYAQVEYQVARHKARTQEVEIKDSWDKAMARFKLVADAAIDGDLEAIQSMPVEAKKLFEHCADEYNNVLNTLCEIENANAAEEVT